MRASRLRGMRGIGLLAAFCFIGASAAKAETVNVLWTFFPSVGGTTIDLQVGDSIEWDVQPGHDLNEMPNQALFDACDFTDSTLISTGPAITPTTFDSPGVHYFACSVQFGFHCESLNMNVTVVVPEPTPELLAVTALASIAILRRLSRPERPACSSSGAKGKHS